MTRHDPREALRQMLDHAREARDLAAGSSRDKLHQDRLLQLATIQLLQILGEAANRVPKAVRERQPTIPWSDITGIRNRLIHGYDTVDFDILWQIVVQDLPPLIATLERTLPPTNSR